ncbi:N-acetylglucosamine-6-sulfatase-like isoform X1 [Malaya genurostris]|uniref:N-acetylglucosamine-6-sulfatase-like isoform X1 n=1 Tax=Malaya genurostris TaxID=325434 RepID=UPI0026F3C7F0|nr:N-acetylglucosamine-6-sulfatase-like isoform X1 [Malaya genurostris]
METLLRVLFALHFIRCVNSDNILPNIVLILTDDQDVILKGLNPMVQTQQLIANQGATFINAFTSSPICCPSRSALLSGQYAHNIKTYNNSNSGGCYGNYWQEKVESATFPVLLQNNGYQTFYAGKYLNEYYSEKIPTGWNEWFGLHGNSKYFNYSLNENGKIVFHTDEYFTDVLKSHVLNFITNITDNKPFFAMVAPPAPHAPYTAADRHNELFPQVKALRTKNFNLPCGPLEKHWLLTMPPSPLPDEIVEKIDIIYRKRWQALMAVDELVAAIFKALEQRNLITNTYIIYTSDNGYHMGQFSQPYDKRQPYETDIKVPFLVRGPDIPHKVLVKSPIALIDVAPTLLDLAGIEVPSRMDGSSFLKKITQPEMDERQILIEYWGEGIVETYNSECPWQKKDKLYLCTTDMACHCQDSWNNTFSCIRHLAKDLDLTYCQFKDTENFAEAYDLKNDLYQINNIAYTILPSIRAKYNLALGNLTECAGATCRRIY